MRALILSCCFFVACGTPSTGSADMTGEGDTLPAGGADVDNHRAPLTRDPLADETA